MFALIVILAATSLAAGLGGLVSGGEADPWYAQLDKAPGTLLAKGGAHQLRGKKAKRARQKVAFRKDLLGQ